MNEVFESLRKEGLSNNASYGLSRLFAFMTEGKELPNEVRKRWTAIGIIEPDGSIMVDKSIAEGNEMAWLMLGMAYDGQLIAKWDEKRGLTYLLSHKGRRRAKNLIRKFGGKP